MSFNNNLICSGINPWISIHVYRQPADNTSKNAAQEKKYIQTFSF